MWLLRPRVRTDGEIYLDFLINTAPFYLLLCAELYKIFSSFLSLLLHHLLLSVIIFILIFISFLPAFSVILFFIKCSLLEVNVVSRVTVVCIVPAELSKGRSYLLTVTHELLSLRSAYN